MILIITRSTDATEHAFQNTQYGRQRRRRHYETQSESVRVARRRRIRALPEAVESSGIVLANQAGRIYMRFMAFRLLRILGPSCP